MNPLSHAAAQIVLADNDKGRGSPIGLFVILVLCIAVYFLWRSLNRQLKKVPPTFEVPSDGSADAPPESESSEPVGDEPTVAERQPPDAGTTV